jgi:beta-glucosidase
MDYIADHLYQVSRLIEDGVAVERYYYWTLMDNFEWLEGESAPFGLIHCDFESQKRTVRGSGRFFAAISRTKGLTQEMIDGFIATE